MQDVEAAEKLLLCRQPCPEEAAGRLSSWLELRRKRVEDEEQVEWCDGLSNGPRIAARQLMEA